MERKKKRGPKTDEQYIVQNGQLRLQLMAEFGIEVGESPFRMHRLLNQHLKHLIRYYRKLPTAGQTTIYQLIGEPAYNHLHDMSAKETRRAYERLTGLMQRHSIEIFSRLPVPIDEMYRFLTQEVFKQKIINIKFPPVFTKITYEQFHPVEALEPKIILHRLIEMSFGQSVFAMDFSIFSKEFRMGNNLDQAPHIEIVSDDYPFIPRRRFIRGEYKKVSMNESAGTASINYHVWYGLQSKKRGRYQEMESDITILLEYNHDKQFERYSHRDWVKWEIVHMEGISF
ncbi:MAG: hypothetical protein IPP77_00195 [Bacteroidetes bacterium]|nr:hypothetical protein [Bacteroidota bacterium]